MKPFLVTLAAAALFISDASGVEAGQNLDFSAAPYVIGKSIIGTDGWERRYQNEKSPIAAEVVAVPWDHDRPALKVKGASLRKKLGGVPKEHYSYEFSGEFAFDFGPGTQSKRLFRLAFQGAPFSEIFFDSGKKGGFGFRGKVASSGNGIMMVPRSGLKPHSFYKLTARVNYAEATYTVELTGEKPDGTPLHYRSEALPFEPGARTEPVMTRVDLITSPKITVYLRNWALR